MKRMSVDGVSICVDPGLAGFQLHREALLVVVEVAVIETNVGAIRRDDKFSISSHASNGKLYLSVTSCIEGEDLLDFDIKDSVDFEFLAWFPLTWILLWGMQARGFITRTFVTRGFVTRDFTLFYNCFFVTPLLFNIGRRETFSSRKLSFCHQFCDKVNGVKSVPRHGFAKELEKGPPSQ